MGLQRVILLALFILTSVLLISSVYMLQPFEEQRVVFVQQSHGRSLEGDEDDTDEALFLGKSHGQRDHRGEEAKWNRQTGEARNGSPGNTGNDVGFDRPVMDDDGDDEPVAAQTETGKDVEDPEPEDPEPEEAEPSFEGDDPEVEDGETDSKATAAPIQSHGLTLPRPVEKEINPSGGKPNAYVNLCVDDNYVFYTIVLFQMLAKVDAHGVFAVMVHNITAENQRLFESLGIQVFPSRGIDIALPFAKGSEERDRKLFSKLRVWELEQFNKIILLDSDMLITQNIDELFDMPEYTASPLIYPREKISFYSHRKNFFKRRFIRATADKKIVGKYGGNSGITVLKPSAATFDEMMGVLKTVKKRLCCPSQEFLYHFFMEKEQFHPLPFKYHYRLRSLIDPELRKQLDKTYKVYHFVERAKPWLQVDETTRMRLARKWWIYKEETEQMLLSKGYKIPKPQVKDKASH